MFTVFFGFITALLVSFALIPSLIRLSEKFSVMDVPDGRKLHRHAIPLLGGVAIFAATVFAFTVFGIPWFEGQHLPIIAALIMLFMLGLRDDLMPVDPLKKISVQLAAALLVALFSDIRLTALHGLFGVTVLPYSVSVMLTLLVIVSVINSFNLVDGIDGLAGGIGMLASAAFGILFYLCGDMMPAVLAFALCGSLAGFLPYNMRNARIFMGDTGSMTIGFVLALFALHLLELSRTPALQEIVGFTSAPVIVLAILIIPVTDMLRVFTIRVFRGRSPFSPDRNHIHHQLLRLGLSPLASTTLLLLLNATFIAAALSFRNISQSALFYSLLIAAIILTQLPALIFLLKKSKQIA